MFSVVVPCFNEESNLEELYSRFTEAAESWSDDYEVIAVDDGSGDATLRKLKEIHEKDPRWKALSLSRNFGHQYALSAGLERAPGDAVIVLDADLQDPPEVITEFIEKWKDGHEVVYAVRRNRKEGPLKKFAYWLFYRMLSKTSKLDDIPLDSGDFCLMDRKVVDVIVRMPERVRFVRGLRVFAGYRHAGIEYDRQARAAGEPQYTFAKLMRLAVDGIVGFSGAPLRIAGLFGFFLAVLSFLGGLFTFFQRIFPDFFASFGLRPVPGYATIVIAILFLGGVQLVFLSIIGEYIYRIFEEVKDRPSWIVAESVGFDDDGKGQA